MLYRLRTDFQLSIITLFGACAVFGILPFAVYRFVSGQLIVGLVDTVIVLCISGAVLYAWRTGDTRRVGMFLAVLIMLGTTVVASMLGVVGLFWMYSTLLATFFLVNHRLAGIFALVAMLLLVIHGKAFQTTPQVISFVVTALLVSLFAFIFAARTDAMRLQLETLATRDPLTGVDNRRAMEKELQIAVEMSRRLRSPCGLVMLDLDHFKRINDGHGHDAGDQVLISFAELIRKSIRNVDRLFRFGGEEFVLLLPGSNVAGLHEVNTRLLNTIAAELRGPDGPVTSSLGAAALAPGEDWRSWLARADAALYQAKGSGRNRAVVDGDLDEAQRAHGEPGSSTRSAGCFGP